MPHVLEGFCLEKKLTLRRIGLAKGDPIPYILHSYMKAACYMNIERSTDGQKICLLFFLSTESGTAITRGVAPTSIQAPSRHM